MKYFTHLPVLLAFLITTLCVAQRVSHAPVKLGIAYSFTELSPDNGSVIIAYRVEERINMNFGGRVTTYTVTDLSMISTKDLGPNNSRRITPIYGTVRVKSLKPIKANLAPKSYSKPVASVTIRMNATAKVIGATSVKINLIDTYERTLQKGFKSIDMLKRVADARYFEGNMEVAAKWYAQLFTMDKNPDAESYHRFAIALKATGAIQKSEEFMALYHAKK